MVSPMYILAIFLGFAFLYPLFEKLGKGFAKVLALIGLLGVSVIAGFWLVSFVGNPTEIFTDTAGFSAPLSINLKIDLSSSLMLLVINLIGLLTLLRNLGGTEKVWQGKQIVLLFVLLLGANGLVLTQDLFNLFVFMEIGSISLFGLMSTSKDSRVHEAGFKYMVAGGLASVFFLVGLGLIYLQTGSLNVAAVIASAGTGALAGAPGVLALLFFLAAIAIELKPFLANGWALDSYESSDSGIGALMSGVLATAMVAVFIKIFPIFSRALPGFGLILMILGALSFFGSQVIALKQNSIKRMLGISSTAQVGLILIVMALGQMMGTDSWRLVLATDQGSLFAGIVGQEVFLIPIILLLNHALAKAGLFWVVDKLGADEAKVSVSGSFRKKVVLVISAGIMILALLGLPPFPSFFAKWSLVRVLSDSGNFLLLAVVLIGSLLEAWYLLRWFIKELKTVADSGSVLGERVPGDTVATDYSAGAEIADSDFNVAGSGAEKGSEGVENASTEVKSKTFSVSDLIPGFISLILLGVGVVISLAWGINLVVLAPIAAFGLFAVLDLFQLPSKIKAFVAFALVGLIAWLVIPTLQGFGLVFGLVFLGGSVVQLIAFFNRTGKQTGLYGSLVALIISLAGLIVAKTNMEFFFSWEMMTLSSFFLVLRGKRSSAAGLRYILFSLLSAFLLLAGISMIGTGNFLSEIGFTASIGMVDGVSVGNFTIIAVLIGLAILIKLAALGLHIWQPASYAEAEDDVSSLMSSVLSKAGIFVLFLAFGLFFFPVIQTGIESLPEINLGDIIGVIGVVTALAGALMAVFQEDIKYTLAYSSMGQIGYIIAAYGLMSHLGWLSSLYLVINHVLFKGMLFLAVAGIISRVKTRLMYQMGGLIKKMPFSFLSVLIAIIAVSGVPPLSGFGGKWLIYSAFLEEGWYLQAGIAMFASGVAFLYLYRLIHSIFLGQPKDIHVNVKEASPWFIIPQMIFMVGIMVISMFPSLLLQPLQGIIETIFGSTVNWDGYTAVSSLGYWNGNAVMYVTMGVFALPLIFLLVMNLKKDVKSVKQFNVVYAAERPYKPETTHYAYNFFAHYRKALGFAAKPWAEKIWGGVSSVGHTISDFLRRWNTGNAQTYGFQILFYLFLMGIITIVVTSGGVQ
jgi:formate hydrogenlyase subunit 3/multisubunit Na+/H+ antiporter MnhD subunit